MNKSELEVRVVAGLHFGARLTLADKQVLVIGCGEHCDVVLLDEGVEFEHLRWTNRQNQWFSEHDNLPVPIGCPIGVGQASIMLCCIEDVAATTFEGVSTRVSRWKKQRQKFIIWLILLMLAWGIMSVIEATTSEALESKDKDAYGAQLKQFDANDSLEEYALRQLRERRLATYVKVNPSSNGIILEGELSEREIELLKDVKSNIHQRFGSKVQVEVQVDPLQEHLPFQINAIVYGGTSHVVLSDDRMVYEGQNVMGYRLIAVRPNHIIWEGARRLELPW